MREPEKLPPERQLRQDNFDEATLADQRFLRFYVILLLSVLLLTANFFGPTFFKAPELDWNYDDIYFPSTRRNALSILWDDLWLTYRGPLAAMAMGGWVAQFALTVIGILCYRSGRELHRSANAKSESTAAPFLHRQFLFRLCLGLLVGLAVIQTLLSGMSFANFGYVYPVSAAALIRCVGMFAFLIVVMSGLSYLLGDRLVTIESLRRFGQLNAPICGGKGLRRISIAQIVVLTTIVAIFLNVERSAIATSMTPDRVLSELEDPIQLDRVTARFRWDQTVVFLTAAVLCLTLCYTMTALVLRIGKRGFAVGLALTLIIAAGPANLAVWKALEDRDRPALESLFYFGCFLYGLLLVSWVLAFTLSCTGYRFVEAGTFDSRPDSPDLESTTLDD